MEARGTLHSWFPLIDTNILVYRFDARYPDKQHVARELLRKGVLQDSVRVPHQAIVEFMAVVTRLTPERRPLLSAGEARRETEELLTQFEVLYPTRRWLERRCEERPPISFPGSMRICGPTRSTTGWPNSSRKISSTTGFMEAYAREIRSFNLPDLHNNA